VCQRRCYRIAPASHANTSQRETISVEVVYSCCGDAASPPPLQTDNALPDAQCLARRCDGEARSYRADRKGIEPMTSWLQTRNPIPAITAGRRLC